MGKLSTHVLDTANGKPAAGMKIDFYKLKQNGERSMIKSVVTNDDGRTDELLLDDASIKVGRYEIEFNVGEYFSKLAGTENHEPAFLEKVPVQFGISDASQNYHVPLLVSPWSYSTYRGS